LVYCHVQYHISSQSNVTRIELHHPSKKKSGMYLQLKIEIARIKNVETIYHQIDGSRISSKYIIQDKAPESLYNITNFELLAFVILETPYAPNFETI
jgi:hypothetical protein